MNILYKMVNPDSIFGFDYILETKDYYIDISCKYFDHIELIKGMYLNRKTHFDDSWMEEREFVLDGDYEVVIVTNEDIKLKKDNRIPYYGKK